MKSPDEVHWVFIFHYFFFQIKETKVELATIMEAIESGSTHFSSSLMHIHNNCSFLHSTALRFVWWFYAFRSALFIYCFILRLFFGQSSLGKFKLEHSEHVYNSQHLFATSLIRIQLFLNFNALQFIIMLYFNWSKKKERERAKEREKRKTTKSFHLFVSCAMSCCCSGFFFRDPREYEWCNSLHQ